MSLKPNKYLSFNESYGEDPKEYTNKYCKDILDLENLKNELINNKVVCVKAYAEWCEPCKKLVEPYDNLSKKYNKKNFCSMISINVDKEELCEGLTAVPAFYFYKEGKLVKYEDGQNLICYGADLVEVEKNIINLLKK